MRDSELCSNGEIIYNSNHCCDNVSMDIEDNVPIANQFNNYYHNLTKYKISDFKPDRSYEGCANYLIVFAPLKNHIDSKYDLRKIEKFMRNKFKYERIVITRETLATRVHYNVIITTKHNATLSNGTIVQKFFLNIQHIANVTHLERIWCYIFKDAKKRPMYPNKDYFIYVKN